MSSEKNTTKILQELIKHADSMMMGMTPEKKLEWLRNKDARKNLFETNPECFLPIKQMDSQSFQPFFIICNRSGATDPEMIQTALKLCKKLVNNNSVCQIELIKSIKKLIRMYKETTGKMHNTNSMPFVKGNATRKLNHILNALQSKA